MSKPIVDKAEVSIDLPTRFYHGSFGHESKYDVRVDDQGLHLTLDRPGEESRHVAVHLHFKVFAGMLEMAAEELGKNVDMTGPDRKRMTDAALALAKVFEA